MAAILMKDLRMMRRFKYEVRSTRYELLKSCLSIINTNCLYLCESSLFSAVNVNRNSPQSRSVAGVFAEKHES